MMILLCQECKQAKEDCMCPEQLPSYLARIRKKLKKERKKGDKQYK